MPKSSNPSLYSDQIRKATINDDTASSDFDPQRGSPETAKRYRHSKVPGSSGQANLIIQVYSRTHIETHHLVRSLRPGKLLQHNQPQHQLEDWSSTADSPRKTLPYKTPFKMPDIDEALRTLEPRCLDASRPMVDSLPLRRTTITHV